MPIPKVKANMSEDEQNEKLYGKVYHEFDFSKPMGIRALAKQLVDVWKFERLFPRTKVLFVQRLEKFEE